MSEQAGAEIEVIQTTAEMRMTCLELRRSKIFAESHPHEYVDDLCRTIADLSPRLRCEAGPRALVAI